MKGPPTMRYHRQLIKGISISIIVLLIAVAILSYLQANYIDNAWYAIFNNIAICILTGGLVALFQSIIGYRNAKRDSLLVYYKDIILLEDKIVHYQYEAIGFVDASKGQKVVQDIITLYLSTVKLSYMQIDMKNNKDKELLAAQNLYNLYNKQIKEFSNFESELCEAIKYMEKTDAELYSEGIQNIALETAKINHKLQSISEKIVDTYNDETDQHQRSNSFKILEQYLFHKKEIKHGV